MYHLVLLVFEHFPKWFLALIPISDQLNAYSFRAKVTVHIRPEQLCFAVELGKS